MLYNITDYAQFFIVVVSPCIIFVQSTVSRFTLTIYSWLLSCLTSAQHKFVSIKDNKKKKKSLKIGDGPETRQSSTCCRDFGIKERENEGREVVLGTLFKLLVKDKLLYNGKVPANANLRPLRRNEEWKFSRYGTLNWR